LRPGTSDIDQTRKKRPDEKSEPLKSASLPKEDSTGPQFGAQVNLGSLTFLSVLSPTR